MLLQALCIISQPLVSSNWSYSPETPNLGQIRRFLEPCDLEIWQMNLKNNRAPLLSNIKLCASFHCHMWIQTVVTVRKRLNGVMTSVTLTFDLWPWTFAWTSLLSLVITPENFMMIRWWEHSQKGVTDRQTDGRTEKTIHRAAWSQLKKPFYCNVQWVLLQGDVLLTETTNDILACMNNCIFIKGWVSLFIYALVSTIIW